MYLNSTKVTSIKEIEDGLHASFSLIREKGYTVALDDVGSGQNSLEKVEYYLNDIDQIKYSLVKFLSKDIQDETNQLFLKAWISFSNKHLLELIVECAEDEETMLYLKNQGVNIQQGYYFSKPSKLMC